MIREVIMNISIQQIFMVGCFFILALYNLNIFILRKDDLPSLYLVVGCIITITRTIVASLYEVANGYLEYVYIVVRRIDYISFIWGPVFFGWLTYTLLPKDGSKRVLMIFNLIAAISTLFVIAVPVEIFTSTYIYDFIIMMEMGYSLLILFKAVIKKRNDAIILTISSLVFMISVVCDVLYNNSILEFIYNLGEIHPYGYIIYLYFHSFVLAKRYSDLFEKTKRLSNDLVIQSRIKDEFLINTSHEIKTPMNGILNITNQVLRETVDVLDEEQKNNLSLAISMTKRLSNIVSDMLDYVRLKHRDIKINKKPVDIKNITESVIKTYEYLKMGKNVRLVNKIPVNTPLVYADEDRVVQILSNLIGNALKFTDMGEIVVAASVKHENVEICVQDTGIGIPEDKYKAIFHSFEQVEPADGKEYRGTGIGLAITKELVEIHGGKIHVYSKVGEGSKFTFNMPVSEVQKEEMYDVFVPFEKLDVSENYTFPAVIDQEDKNTILLVDDNYFNLLVLIKVLKHEGYSIIAVNDADSALKEVQSNRNISLVVLDVMMPDMSGYEVCEEIRRRFSLFEMPVLLLTVKNSVEDILHGFESGANDFLTKPFESVELIKRIRTLVQLKTSVKAHIETELAFLRMQIKPHFLYNSLSLISSLITRQPEKAKSLLLDFSDYLRLSFRFESEEGLVNLSEELNMVELYLNLVKARYKDRFHIVFNVDKKIKLRIPMLIIQPLVENAIMHGVFNKSQGGIVEIVVANRDGYVNISVRDNGKGMTQEKIDEVLKKGKNETGVGLANINKRLLARYGQGLLVKSSVGEETTVEINLSLI